jgi:hypothetical protein
LQIETTNHPDPRRNLGRNENDNAKISDIPRLLPQATAPNPAHGIGERIGAHESAFAVRQDDVSMMTPKEFCKKHNVCKEAEEFAAQFSTLSDVWENCKRPDWMINMIQMEKIENFDKDIRTFAISRVRNLRKIKSKNTETAEKIATEEKSSAIAAILCVIIELLASTDQEKTREKQAKILRKYIKTNPFMEKIT